MGGFELLKEPDLRLKPYALFFDHIILPDLDARLWGQTVRISRVDLLHLEFLRERGFIKQHRIFGAEAGSENSVIKQRSDDFYIALQQWGISYMERAQAQNSKRQRVQSGPFKFPTSQADITRTESWVRLVAAQLRFLEGVDAICIGRSAYNAETTKDIDREVSRDGIYEVIIDHLPVISDTVPWDDVLAFKADPTSRRQLLELRLWVNDLANGRISFIQANDKIAYMKEAYKSQLRGAGIKFSSSTFKTLVVGVADIIESSLKLKIKNLAEIPFKIFDAQRERIEGARTATGHELSYLISASKRFSK